MQERKNFITKFLKAQKTVEAKYLIFLSGIFFLSWPFLIALRDKPQAYPFYFYFLVWVGILLLLIGASLGEDKSEENEEK